MRAGCGISQHLPSDSPLREPSPEAFLQHRYLVLEVKASAVHHQNQPLSGATRLLEKPKEQIFRLFASAAMQIHVRLHREVSGAQFPQCLTVEAWNCSFDVLVGIAELDRSPRARRARPMLPSRH